MTRRILYLVTEDWYFLSHRLPMARAARDAGYEVHVATRVGEGGAQIEREGFRLHSLSWRRGSRSPADNLQAIREVRGILRRVKPDILHNIAVKPVLIGTLAAAALPRISVVNSFAGLGSSFLARSVADRILKGALGVVLRQLLSRKRSRAVVQNPDDRAALERLGVRPQSIVLIQGSGVDVDTLQVMPEPPPPVTAAYVGRMLEDKGLRALIEAHRLLRTRDERIELILAGSCDEENPGSLAPEDVAAWGEEPHIIWLGQVKNISDVWAQAHIAVLPSRREGLPLSLLEAAACGRPMVATDVPGCREIAREGETALLVPVDDSAALADALQKLAGDAKMRQRFGRAARKLAASKFSAKEIGRRTVALYDSLSA